MAGARDIFAVGSDREIDVAVEAEAGLVVAAVGSVDATGHDQGSSPGQVGGEAARDEQRVETVAGCHGVTLTS